VTHATTKALAEAAPCTEKSCTWIHVSSLSCGGMPQLVGYVDRKRLPMSYQLRLPAELAPAASILARDADFRRRRSRKARWSCPRLLLWLARLLHGELAADSTAIIVARAGFRGIGRPWRTLRALVVLIMAARRQRCDRVPLLAWTFDEPKRYGPTDSILRPSYYGSPAGPLPAPEAPPLRPLGTPNRPPPGSAPNRPAVVCH
jgi:hypothetical protein